MASSQSASAPAAAPAARRVASLTRGLVRRAARGEPAAFEQIFERFHQEIYRYCLAILRHPTDAEDALQATMAAALRSLPGEDREIALKPWLYRIAHNESISILRRRREAAAGDRLPEEVGPGADFEVEQRERMQALVADLKALPERQRGALIMRELSGLAYEEIGAALDCGDGAARQIVYEARQALQVRAEGRGMDCETVRGAISARDGRRLRGRAIRAHLAACDSCLDFRAAIEVRRADFAELCPPLPAATALAMLSGLLGGAGGTVATGAAILGGAGGSTIAGGAAGGVAGGGGLAGGLGGGLAVKGASVLAATVIGAGAGDLAGVVDLPIPTPGGSDREAPERAKGGAPAAAPHELERGAAGNPGSERAGEARSQGVDSSAAKGANGKGASAKGRNGALRRKRALKGAGRPGAAGRAPGSRGPASQAPSNPAAGAPAGPPSHAPGRPEGVGQGGSAGGAAPLQARPEPRRPLLAPPPGAGRPDSPGSAGLRGDRG